MKLILPFLFLLNYSDSLQRDSLSVDTVNTKNFKFNFMIHTDFFKRRTSGAGFILEMNKLKLTAGFGILHRTVFFYEDSITSILPYTMNDSALFFKVRHYSNQKYFLRAGVESNFRTFKNGSSLQLGFNLYTGKYSFQDYYAEVHYDYYRDSLTGELYYEDIYGDPSWDPLDAYAQVSRFSKADMEFRTYAIEPYLAFYNEIKKGKCCAMYISGKYEYFKTIKDNYLDYADILESPHNNFNQFKLNLRFALILQIG